MQDTPRMRRALPLVLAAIAIGADACSERLRSLLSASPRPCARCDELLALCDGPRTWHTVHTIRDLLRELELE